MAERNGPESIAGEMRALVTQTERLIRSEFTLAAVRGKEALASGSRRAVLLVASATLSLGGLAYLFHAIYSALSIRLDHWAAALVTAGISFAAAGLLASVALRRSDDRASSPTNSRMAVR